MYPMSGLTSSGRRETSMPQTSARPPLARTSVARILIVVDFPAPFGPMNPNASPASISRSRSRQRGRAAIDLREALGADGRRHGRSISLRKSTYVLPSVSAAGSVTGASSANASRSARPRWSAPPRPTPVRARSTCRSSPTGCAESALSGRPSNPCSDVRDRNAWKCATWIGSNRAALSPLRRTSALRGRWTRSLRTRRSSRHPPVPDRSGTRPGPWA